jgi:hypothetical protein
VTLLATVHDTGSVCEGLLYSNYSCLREYDVLPCFERIVALEPELSLLYYAPVLDMNTANPVLSYYYINCPNLFLNTKKHARRCSVLRQPRCTLYCGRASTW